MTHVVSMLTVVRMAMVMIGFEESIRVSAGDVQTGVGAWGLSGP